MKTLEPYLLQSFSLYGFTTRCVPNETKRDKNNHEIADMKDDKECHSDLTLKCCICNTKPTGATRFLSHAL